MSKTALLFPGQASQYVGMGKDLYDASADVRELYTFASDEMQFDIAKLSFEGPAEQLKQTRFTQPAILLHSLSVLTMLGDSVPDFDYTAGHSLGEYGALAVSGTISFKDAIRAVVKRASLMEEACQRQPGTMAAVMGLQADKLEAVCADASKSGVVVAANYNSSIQIAISGELSAVEKAVELSKEAGAKRAMLLEVGGAFHSPLMDSARDGMSRYLEGLEFGPMSTDVIANVTAETIADSSEVGDLLVRQITSPVRWAQTMAYLKDAGVTTLYEIGPGKVLTGLAKREMRPEKSTCLDSLANIEALLSATV